MTSHFTIFPELRSRTYTTINKNCSVPAQY